MKQSKLKLKLFERGLNQHQLARHLDVTETVISQWINGTKEVPADRKSEIAKVLRCEAHEFFPETKSRKSAQ